MSFRSYRLPFTGRAVRVGYISPPAPRATFFSNSEQSYTALCAVGDGSFTVTVPAGVYTSWDSQAYVDGLAYAQAVAQAEASLVCCYSEDPQPDTPDFDSLFNPVVYPGSSQYGLEGVEDIRQDTEGGISQLQNWTICPSCDFSDGPEIEGLTQEARYMTRWAVRSDALLGTVQYGIDGSVLQEVPADLFAGVDKTLVSTISIGFDGNALAGFALQVTAGSIQLRRYVAGTPTTHTFSGDWPRLFYDGIVQRDAASIDLVCFYVRDGGVRMRFQRDNFGVEYDFLIPALPVRPVVRLTKVDRFSAYQYAYFIDDVGVYWLARSAVYPPFPVIVSDLGTNSVSPAGGEYLPAIVDGGTYADEATNGAEPSGGSYDSNTISTGPYADDALNFAAPSTGEYTEVVVSGGAYSESATNTTAPSTGEYEEKSVNGGTYTENATNSAVPSGGEYAIP